MPDADGPDGSVRARLVHDKAINLWHETIRPDDRILVIGASGWFGRTAAALTFGLDIPSLYLASSRRNVDLGFATIMVEEWSDAAVAAFEPTVVIDCAFLTRERTESMSLEDYVSRNRVLMARMRAVAVAESVSRVVTVSSGAAVHPVDALTEALEANPYGRLKREMESELAAISQDRTLSVVAARAWSVSGAYVAKPRNYALADMILQARTGEIRIFATSEVFRRYVSVEDLLAVALASCRSGFSVLDSGGPLVEMQELADAIVATLNSSAKVTRPPRTNGVPNRYHSSGVSWDEACASLRYTPATLREQVKETSVGLAQLEP